MTVYTVYIESPLMLITGLASAAHPCYYYNISSQSTIFFFSSEGIFFSLLASSVLGGKASARDPSQRVLRSQSFSESPGCYVVNRNTLLSDKEYIILT
jgi:hypothetical protein